LALLKEARFGLATEDLRVQDYQAAANLLEMILSGTPKDTRALNLLETVYTQWYNDSVSRGDWLTAFSVALHRNARFPNDR
jgi:Tfp pilus assembly protein PilF